ncbi:hypothetical protein BJ742DRAFT_854469 [Cladochytrium replicatum]|nr:hypothetical protein BJ742DRAFT_854469 [Cladochytrium replicatum]
MGTSNNAPVITTSTNDLSPVALGKSSNAVYLQRARMIPFPLLLSIKRIPGTKTFAYAPGAISTDSVSISSLLRNDSVPATTTRAATAESSTSEREADAASCASPGNVPYWNRDESTAREAASETSNTESVTETSEAGDDSRSCVLMNLPLEITSAQEVPPSTTKVESPAAETTSVVEVAPTTSEVESPNESPAAETSQAPVHVATTLVSEEPESSTRNEEVSTSSAGKPVTSFVESSEGTSTATDFEGSNTTTAVGSGLGAAGAVAMALLWRNRTVSVQMKEAAAAEDIMATARANPLYEAENNVVDNPRYEAAEGSSGGGG